jgi:hypothetical protein
MDENSWKCEKCGSTRVDQEWTFYAAMNEQADDNKDLEGAIPRNYYWCNDCEDECNPNQDEE